MIDSLYSLIYKFAAFIIRIILWMCGGVEVRGRENVPATGGVLVAANHISYIDPPVIGSVLPRQACFMARKGLFKMPILGWMIKRAAFPVDRERPRPSTIKDAVRRLKNGGLITIFPEGRRNETGELLEAKRGLGVIAAMSNVPVVPAMIAGTDKVLPKDAKWLKRGKILVVFDKPIHYTFSKEDRHQFHEDLTNQVMSAIGNLKEQHEDYGS
jgi:1-acyl-sn-glycerol-3-phosphate acyltransferase